MSILGNILWFICGGLLSGLSWIAAGCLWCISIIGIPIGLQCFKFAGLAFSHLGKKWYMAEARSVSLQISYG